MRGFDLSSYQGHVDWPALKAAGAEFVLIRAGGADDPSTGLYIDLRFAENWAGAAAVGLQRGAYYFCRPATASGAEQADHFAAIIQSVGSLQVGDLLAGDFETGSGNLAAFACDFLRRLEAWAGFKPFLYSGGWFTGPHGLDQDGCCTSYPLWDAAYTGTEPPPPGRWPAITIWQRTSGASVPGISGNVDEDYFAGTAAQLPAFGKPAAPPQEDDMTPQQEQMLTEVHTMLGGLYAAMQGFPDPADPNQGPGGVKRELDSIRVPVLDLFGAMQGFPPPEGAVKRQLDSIDTKLDQLLQRPI